MSNSFSKTEAKITQLFKINHSFLYNSVKYTIINSGKPSPSKGECKTDSYILAEDKNGNRREFKISIKQKNADFVENKMSFERAYQIFGEDANQILIDSIRRIEKEFTNDYLVTFNRYKRTEAKTLKIGWKFELVNKKSGNKSEEIKLSSNQIFDAYAGTNLDNSKKNSKINGHIVENSGVANFIFFADSKEIYTCQEIVNAMTPIKEFIKGEKIYFACKAINFRVSKDKWDGNRPLAVYIDWSIIDNNIHSKIIFDKPLKIKANQIGEKIRIILNQFNISTNNFNHLKDFLVNTNYFE